MAYPYVWGMIEADRARIRCQDTGEVVLGSKDFAFIGGSISNLDELPELAGVGEYHQPEELVGALYRKRGYGGLNLLKGDFVIVLWQGREQALTLVRDKFGIHNIYYLLANGTFAFSTSLSQLVSTGLVGKDIDLNSLYQFFSLGVVLPPRTIFQKVSSVEPGQCIRFQAGKLETNFYFNLELPGEKFSDRRFLVERYRQLLTGAVSRSVEGADRIGVCLSGGVDSAFLLSLAKQEGRGKAVFAITIGPWGETSSDLAYARLSAGFSGVKQVERHVGVADLNHLPRVVALMEQPNFDTTALAFYLLAEEARKYGISLMLSGQNADTMMGAMPYVKYIYWSDRLQHYLTRRLSRALSRLSAWLPQGLLRNRLSFLLTPEHGVAKLLHFKTQLFYQYRDSLFPFLGRIDEAEIFQPLYDSVARIADSDIADVVIYWDEKFTEAPRCLEAMQKPADGVTVKLPYYDQDVVDFSLKVPNKVRAEEVWDKMLLRDAAKSLVHRQLYRKKMKSLTFPTHRWFGEILRERVPQFLAADNFLKEFVNIDQLSNIFRLRRFNYGDIIYQVLLLAVWYRINFEVSSEVTKDTTLEEVLGFDLLGQGQESGRL